MAKKTPAKNRIDPEAKTILARQALRYRVLRMIHDLAEGAVERRVQAYELARRENMDTLQMEQVLAYLRDEKLIYAAEYSISSVSLRHKGLVEIERAILDPMAGTEHFDAKVTSAYRKDSKGNSQTMRIATDSET